MGSERGRNERVSVATAEEEEKYWQGEDDDIALSPRPAEELYRQVMSYKPPLPEGWEEVQSRSRPGEISYQNTKTGRRTRVRPTEPTDAAVSPAPTPASAVASRTPNQMITTTTAPTPDRSAITTTASNPGDAPFIKGNEFAPPRGPPPRKRELYFYVQILTFGNIKVTDQSFQAYFYLKAAWCEPEIEQKLDGKDGMRKKMDTFTADFSEAGSMSSQNWPDDLFDPKLDFMNVGNEIKIFKAKLEVSPWRTGPKKEPVVEYSFYVRGTFIESLELRAFPFDVQPLRISVSTSLPDTLIDLHEDTKLGVKCALRPEFLVNPEFYIPTKLPLKDGTDVSQPILIRDHKSFTNTKGDPFPILHMAVIAQRIPGYYIQNIFIPMFLIVSMSGAAFVCDPADLEVRFAVTVTLTLVIVAYKCGIFCARPPSQHQTNVAPFLARYAVADFLPHLSYFTLCDQYIMMSFIFLTAALLQNGVAGWIALKAQTNADDDADDDNNKKQKFSDDFSNVSEWALFATFVAYNLYFGHKCWSIYSKNMERLRNEKEIRGEHLADQPRGDVHPSGLPLLRKKTHPPAGDR